MKRSFLEEWSSVVLVHPDYPGGVCVYCGETADTVDHIVPTAFTGDSLRPRIPVVPACRECNSTLSDRHLLTVWERREWLHSHYRKRYRSELLAIVMGEAELLEYGPTMRKFMQRREEEHVRAMKRLAFPTDADYDTNAYAAAWEEECSAVVDDELVS